MAARTHGFGVNGNCSHLILDHHQHQQHQQQHNRDMNNTEIDHIRTKLAINALTATCSFDLLDHNTPLPASFNLPESLARVAPGGVGCAVPQGLDVVRDT